MIRRVIGLVGPGGLADLSSACPGGADSVAVDGKAARGSRYGETPTSHLLATMIGDGRDVTQLRVPDKTNEIARFAAFLKPYDLTGVTFTADALHTQRDHARSLVEEKNAHYLLGSTSSATSLRRGRQDPHRPRAREHGRLVQPGDQHLREHGHRNIAAGLRHTSHDPFNRPLELLNIP